MRQALIFIWTVGLAAGAAYDSVEVLERVRRKVVAVTSQIPNYTCVETVQRDYFSPMAATLPRACEVLLEQRKHPTLDLVLRRYSTDRLRLDVTMAGKGEIFSWSGASRFEEADIDHLVRNGPIATGSFGAFLNAVFRTDVKGFKFDGSMAADGRTLMEYSFQVPKSESHYRIKADNSWVSVAYSGTFEADAETADVVRMTIITGDLPLATGTCQSSNTMNFGMVQIGDGQFLIPTLARQRFVYPDAEEVENTTGFTNCREFRGTSTVTYFPDSEAVTDTGAKSASGKAPPLPAGLRFSLVLTAAIPTDTAAAGDAFSARLADALRDSKSKVLAPKGTLVEGHLMRVQSFSRPPEVLVVFVPEVLWVRGVRVPFSAVRDWTRVRPRIQGEKGIEILLAMRREGNAGVFRFSGDHVVIPSGFRSDWRTASADASGWAPR